MAPEGVLERFAGLGQLQRSGQRSPHKALLVLLALGRLARTGSSALPWSTAAPAPADLIAEFGPPSRTGRALSAAYPFTRMRADGVWVLDQDVPMNLRTAAGRALYELDDQPLSPRPGTPFPAKDHLAWHRRQVFKGTTLGQKAMTPNRRVGGKA